MEIGYARVSTEMQNLDSQIDALKKHGCEKILQEKLSGKNIERPEFLIMQDQLRKGDTVVVYDLSRVGRNFGDLINIVNNWKKQEINFISLTESINLNSEFGEMTLRIMAVIADYNRAKIREKVLAGLASARARGRVGGKKNLLSPKEIKRLQQLHNEKELSIKELCDMFDIAKTTLYRYINT